MTNMKKAIKIISVFVLIALLALTACGCKSKIVAGETYYLSVYDTDTDRFVRSGAAIRFGDDLETFEYCFGDEDITVTGSVERTENPDTLIISCHEEMLNLANERYRAYLEASGADQVTIDLYDAVAENLSSRSQYFVYEGNFFSATSVELFREADDHSDSFEGIYRTGSTDDLVKLRGGYIYTQDEDGEYTVKSGRYSVSRGILTWIKINEDGSEYSENGVYFRKRYLMAKITIPECSTLVGTSLEGMIDNSYFIKKITTDLSEYSGKTVCVLSEEFYSKDLT